KTRGVLHQRLGAAVPALQGARSPLRPAGYAVSAAPLLCTVSPRLRHGRKTRYGWVARPYPTRTCTSQETPSCSWHENAGPQAPPMAGARYERRLLAVACRPWLGVICRSAEGFVCRASCWRRRRDLTSG